MLDRKELVLKIVCGVVGALVLYRLVLVVVHINPLYHVRIPALPSLASNAVAEASVKGTNSPGQSVKPGTNGVGQASRNQGTNHLPQTTTRTGGLSNSLSHATNVAAVGTNLPVGSTSLLTGSSNSLAQSTNTVASVTNSPPASGQPTPAANARPPAELAGMMPPPGPLPGMPPGGLPSMPPGARPGTAKPGPALAPELQSRIDRVIDSEILAPVMRPMPMALLGIAGNTIFFRAPNGQTGLIKQGEELGGVKLVRIGINRVLVEEQGEQKELTIFAGLGGDSLISTTKNSPK